MTIDSPPSHERPVNIAEAPRKDRVRWIVAIHLVGVVLCFMFSFAGSGLLINENISHFFNPTAEWPDLLAILPLLVCPLLMLVELTKDGVSRRSVVLGVIAEMLLCMTHVFVLLPAVQ